MVEWIKEYGKGKKYGIGMHVIIMSDYRSIKWGGDFKMRVGIIKDIITIYMKDDDNKIVPLSENYPIIKVKIAFLNFKIEGMQCFWLPVDEAIKALSKEDKIHDIGIVKGKLKLTKIGET